MLTMLTVKPIIQERFPFLLLSKGSRRYRRRHTWKFQIHLWLGKKTVGFETREKFNSFTKGSGRTSDLDPEKDFSPGSRLYQTCVSDIHPKRKNVNFITCATIRSSRRWANSYQNIGMFANRAARGPGGIGLDWIYPLICIFQEFFA